MVGRTNGADIGQINITTTSDGYIDCRSAL